MTVIKSKKTIKNKDLNIKQPKTIVYDFCQDGNKYVISNTSSTDSPVVSAKKGFPAIMSEQIGIGGGSPVLREDFNSAINYVFNYVKYFTNGGLPTFSQDVVDNLGGYQSGAVLLDTEKQSFKINLVDNNTSQDNNWLILSYKDITDENGNITFNGNTITTGVSNFNLITAKGKSEFENRPKVLSITDKNNNFATLKDTESTVADSIFNKNFILTCSNNEFYNRNFGNYSSNGNYNEVYLSNQFPAKYGNTNLQNSVIAKTDTNTKVIDFFDYNASISVNNCYANFRSTNNYIYNTFSNSYFNAYTNIPGKAIYASFYLYYFKHNENGVFKNIYYSLKISNLGKNFGATGLSDCYNQICVNYDNYSLKETPVLISSLFNFTINKICGGMNKNNSSGAGNFYLKSPIIQTFDTIKNKNFYIIQQAYDTNLKFWGIIKTYDFKTFEALVVNTTTTKEIKWININSSVPSGFSIDSASIINYVSDDLKIFEFSNTFFGSNKQIFFNSDLSSYTIQSDIGNSERGFSGNQYGIVDSIYYSVYDYFNLNERFCDYSVNQLCKNETLTKNTRIFRFLDNKKYFSSYTQNDNKLYDLKFIDENNNVVKTNISFSSNAGASTIPKFYKTPNGIFYFLNKANSSANTYINNVLVESYAKVLFSNDYINFEEIDLTDILGNTQYTTSLIYLLNDNFIITQANSRVFQGNNSALFPFSTILNNYDYATDLTAYICQFSSPNTDISKMRLFYTKDFKTILQCEIEDFEEDFGNLSNLTNEQKRTLKYIFYTNKNDNNKFLNICTDNESTTNVIIPKSVTYLTTNGINYKKIDTKTSTKNKQLITTVIHFANGFYFKFHWILNSDISYMQTSVDGINWEDTNLITSDWNSTENGIYRFLSGVYTNGIIYFNNTYYTNVFETTTVKNKLGNNVILTQTKTYKSTNRVNWELCNINSNKSGYINSSANYATFDNADANKVVRTTNNSYMPFLKYPTV